MTTKITSSLWVVSNADDAGKNTGEVVRVAASEGGKLVGLRFDKAYLKNAPTGIDLTAANCKELADALVKAADMALQPATTTTQPTT